jgi:alpha-1,3-glucan synthase
VHDSRTENYIYGRQPMTSSRAWQLHGCYQGNASYQFRNMPFSQKTREGCLDDQVSLDHFDYTHPEFRYIQQLYTLRSMYPSILVDGFELVTMSRTLAFPDQDLSANGIGEVVWSVRRRILAEDRSNNFTVSATDPPYLWYIFTNSHQAVRWSGLCSNPDRLVVPYGPRISLRNILPPFQTILTGQTAAGTGCVDTIELPPFGYYIFTESAYWKPLAPVLTKTTPSHDQRIEKPANVERISVLLELEFSQEMVCLTVAPQVSFEVRQGAPLPEINVTSIRCEFVSNRETDFFLQNGAWKWSATINNVTDGITKVNVGRSILSYNSTGLQSAASFMFRVGTRENPLVFPFTSNNKMLQKDASKNTFSLYHSAVGADLYRYSLDYGRTWFNWTSYEPVTNNIQSSAFYMATPGEYHAIVEVR